MSSNSPSFAWPTQMTLPDLKQLEGKLIPRHFTPVYVLLSIAVSYVGAVTTLEIMHRKTSERGLYNWLVLLAASLSMGGIAIWGMHYIGNLAIVLGAGEKQIQIAYSAGYTTVSFFLPVTVLYIAFGTAGISDEEGFNYLVAIRVLLGGGLAGLGICGMHYLGQAAALIAIVASIAVLGWFFVVHSAWDSTWRKRALLAIILAGAVCGMHWVGSTGTQYRLRENFEHNIASNFRRTSTVVVIAIFSFVGALTLLLFTGLYHTQSMQSARRAQQIVLAAVIFDMEGRILVSPDGLLPIKKITNAWHERTLNDVFTVSHPVFLWIFRTTRNWEGVVNLVPAMRRHVYRKGIKSRIGSDTRLLNDEGNPIDEYTQVFQELFCIAAADLADDLNQPLDRIGVLYDEIISTGKPPTSKIKDKDLSERKMSQTMISSSLVDLERNNLGLPGFGKGQLLFLVSRVGRREAEHLEAAGFRFAAVPFVNERLSERLEVRNESLARRLSAMCKYATTPPIMDPGVHFACFAIRASLGASRHGFDILVRRDAKNQLPTVKIAVDELKDWEQEFLDEMDGFTVATSIKHLMESKKANNPSGREREFARILLQSLESLKLEVEDPLFSDAMLIAKPVQVPCRSKGTSTPGTAFLLAFRVIMPIYSRAPGTNMIFTPIAFFKAQQLVYPNSLDHAAFARKTYRELAPLLELKSNNEEGQIAANTSQAQGVFGGSPRNYGPMRTSGNLSLMGDRIDQYGNPLLGTSNPPHCGSWDIRFWDRSTQAHKRDRSDGSDERDLLEDSTLLDSSGTGGIMVCQDFDINVKAKKKSSSTTTPFKSAKKNDKSLRPPLQMKPLEKLSANGIFTLTSAENADRMTFVEHLFQITIEKRTS